MNRDAWMERLSWCGSHERIGKLRRCWRYIAHAERAEAMAWALGTADLLAPHLAWLGEKLVELRRRNERVFDCDRARTEFDQLPERLTVYRGTVEAERRPRYGISWTVDRERAVWFATEHGRFRNLSSPPVLLRAEIARDDASGYLVDRDEAEVLVTVDVLSKAGWPMLEHLARVES